VSGVELGRKGSIASTDVNVVISIEGCSGSIAIVGAAAADGLSGTVLMACSAAVGERTGGGGRATLAMPVGASAYETPGAGSTDEVSATISSVGFDARSRSTFGGKLRNRIPVRNADTATENARLVNPSRIGSPGEFVREQEFHLLDERVKFPLPLARAHEDGRIRSRGLVPARHDTQHLGTSADNGRIVDRNQGLLRGPHRRRRKWDRFVGYRGERIAFDDA